MPLDPQQRLRNLSQQNDDDDPNYIPAAIQGVANQALQSSQDATGYNHLLGMANYQPTPALNQYQQFLQNAPQQQNYQPSIGRRIAAAIAGGLAGASTRQPGLGYTMARDIVQRPWEQAVQGFDTRAQMLGKAADIEGRSIANEARIAGAEQRAESAEQMMKIRQEQADTQQKKEDDIRKQKENELNERIREADNRAQQAKDALNQKDVDSLRMQEYHNAAIQAANDRASAERALQQIKFERTLADTDKKHQADLDLANQRLQETIRENQAKDAARNQPKPPPVPTTTTTETTQEPEHSAIYNFLTGHGYQATGKVKTSTSTKTPLTGAATTQSGQLRKEIPGMPGKYAISTDGGKTWKAE